MNQRQRAKQAAKKTDPVQAAWDVVAAHLLTVDPKAPCFFVVEEGYSRQNKRLSLYNMGGFKLVSNPPTKEVKKK